LWASLVLALAAAPSAAQDSRASLADTVLKLESREPARIAWGAWQAKEARERRAIPYLAPALARLAPCEDREARRFAALGVLGALLALEAPASVAELEPFLDDPETRIPALALLARARAPDLAFFRELLVQRKNDGHERHLAGNVLAAAKAPGFAAQALAGVDFTLEVAVTDTGNPTGRIRTIELPRLDQHVPEGFPPATFFLWLPWADDAPIRLPGKNAPLGLQSHEVGAPGLRVCVALCGAAEVSPELCWIADLLSVERHELGIAQVTSRRVSWTGAAALKREVDTALRGLAEKHEALVARLVANRLMTAGEAKARRFEPRIEIVDQRAERGVALPDIEGAGTRR
jgi:hypothetical protein